MDLKEKITERKIEDLIPYSQNPKKHPPEQIDKIASSIKKFGFKVPMLITEDNEIIAGHGRLKAARKLDRDKVPVIVVDDLTKAEIKAFRLADNRVAESEWDEEKLAVELEEIDELDMDLENTGFDEDEIQTVGDWDVSTTLEPESINLMDRPRTKKNMIEFKKETAQDLGIDLFYEDDKDIVYGLLANGFRVKWVRHL